MQPPLPPAEVPGTGDPALTAGVMVAFLRTGRHVDHASSVLLLVAFLLQPWQGAAPWAGLAAAMSLLLGAAEKYYAWRVALDTELFALLGVDPARMPAFDDALAACLGRSAAVPPRSLSARWRGARRLLGRQAGACVLQALAVAALFAIKVLPA